MSLLLLALLSGNLLVNPAFADGMRGWSLWSRQEGALKVDAVNASVHLTHTGKDDWALAQQAGIETEPRMLYRISAMLKANDLGSAEIGVVAKDAAGGVLSWSYGSVSTSGTHDWRRFERRLMVPDRCRSVQFRLIGSGAGEIWMREPRLESVGALRQQKPLHPLTVHGSQLDLTVDTHGAITAVNRKTWQRVGFAPLPPRLQIQDLNLVTFSPATGPSGSLVRMKLWDAENDLELSADLTLHETSNESSIGIELNGTGKQQSAVPFPGPILTKNGQQLIVPMNEGISYPVDDTTIPPIWLVAYGGHGICMPWYGVVEPKSGIGAMTILETPDDASIQMDRFDKKCLSVQNQFEPSRGAFVHRSVRIYLTAKGGYVAQAKLYRRHTKVGAKPLAVKVLENPNVDRLIGAINVWTWEPNKVEICQEMKAMGMKRVLWSGGGSADEIRKINAMGYLGGRYDIYQDVWDPKAKLDWMPSTGWPHDLVLLQNGEWMKGWAHPDKQPDGTTKWYQGGVICSKPGLERAQKAIPEDMRKTPYLARFIDTTTASPFRECYNPAHPLTRSQDRRYKMDLLRFCSSDMRLVTGCETGIDPSVPYVHYYEGMMSLGPYRLPDSGTDMMAYRKPTPDFLKYQVGYGYRLPLWELVYHDCVVSQWYWGDASNKAPEVWDDRDLWNLLYGTAPLVMFDKAKWALQKDRILQTYLNVCENVRKIGYDQMLSHEFLTSDRSVQRTRWSSGHQIVVNFGSKPYRLGSKTVNPMGFIFVGVSTILKELRQAT